MRKAFFLHGYARALAVATLVLISAGGVVTSTGSGLSVPDWPTTYGYNMFTFPLSKWVGGIRYEHSHRLIGSAVGILTIGLCLLVYRLEPRRWVRRLAYLALPAVIAQGVLGGLTVRYLLPAPISIAHACLAQAFFCLVVALGTFFSRRWQEESRAPSTPATRAVHRHAVALAAIVYFQLFLGAIVRHTDAGLAIPDFPLMLGRAIPPFLSKEVAFHFAHRAWAVVVVLAGLALVFRTLVRTREPRLWRPAVALGALLFGQVALGAATVLSKKATLPATAHVATGALLLGVTLVLALRSWRSGAPAAAPEEPVRRRPSRLEDYAVLSKPRVTALVLVTTLVGFALASQGGIDPFRLLATLAGTALLASGTAALNQLIEREHDRLMARTADRPLPAGRIGPGEALALGLASVLGGLAILLFGANALAAALGAATVAGYLFVYTPLKRLTPFCTIVGAVPGALPPVIGWAAARGALDVGAAALFAIIFVWQLPHFFAIAWIYRDDYARAGYRMLTVVDPAGRRAAWQIALFSTALVPLSLAPTFIGLSGRVYFAGALALGLGQLALGVATSRRLLSGRVAAQAAARGLFLGSLVYLPALFSLMTVDRP